jgi:hypothetical protein
MNLGIYTGRVREISGERAFEEFLLLELMAVV